MRIDIRTLFLALYIVLLPLGVLSTSIGGSVLKYIALLPVAANIFYLMKAKNKELHTLHVMYLILLLLMTVALFYTISIDETMKRLQSYLLFIGLLVTSTLCPYNKKQIYFITKAYIWAARITAVLVLTLGSSTDKLKGRISFTSEGFKEDPNYLCGYFIFAIIFLLNSLLSKTHSGLTKKITAVLELLLYFYIVILTGSRGGAIAVILSILAFGILYFLENKKSIAKLLLFVAVIALSYIIAVKFIHTLPDEVQKRYLLSSIISGDATGRYELWRSAFYIFQNSDLVRQIFGYGPGTILSIGMGANTMTNVAHNLWLESLVEYGVLGTITYGILMLQGFRLAIIKGDKASAAALIGFLALSLSLSISDYKPLWNLMIIISLRELSNLRTTSGGIRDEKFKNKSQYNYSYF